MKIEIRIASAATAESIQNVLNHKEVIGFLGGFVMLDQIKAKSSPKGGISMWYAFDTDAQEVVGAMEVGGRTQAHFLKYGMVGVLPAYQRRRIGSALYTACTIQGLIEGRRLFEDSIVGDNDVQFKALPKLGLQQVATLPHRTGSAKDICLFVQDMIDGGQQRIRTMLERTFPEGGVVQSIEVMSNYYTDDLWAQNQGFMAKYLTKDQVTNVISARTAAIDHAGVKLRRDDVDPTAERRKQYAQQRITGE